jgi:hypothetical protein
MKKVRKRLRKGLVERIEQTSGEIKKMEKKQTDVCSSSSSSVSNRTYK